MINEEIVGGLKNALERGDSLKNAMISFYNAGYDKKEIEEAAKTLLNYPTAKPEATPEPAKKIEIKKEIPPQKIVQKVSQYGEENIPVPKMVSPVQKEAPKELQKLTLPAIQTFIPKELPKTIITALPQTTPKKAERQAQISSSAMTSQEKAIIAILVGLLIFLVGLLVTIFLFRQQLIDFISSMVS